MFRKQLRPGSTQEDPACPVYGRKNSLSGGKVFLALLLLALLGGIFGYALQLIRASRVEVLWIDPYVTVRVEGADGYGLAVESIDREGFRRELEELLRAKDRDLEEEEIRELAGEAAESLYPVMEYDFVGREGEEDSHTADMGDPLSEDLQADSVLPSSGLSNGDTVTLYVYVSDEVQVKLRDRGFNIAFECDPVSQTAEGLPEANPYDAFEDLDVTFYGLSGAGQVSLAYRGSYPFSFAAEPAENLRNGDEIRIRISFEGEYAGSLDRIIEDYHIMPLELERSYLVSGLWISPSSISDFTAENTEELLEKAAFMAGDLIEEEYNESERIDSLDRVGLYFAVPAEEDGEAAIPFAGTESDQSGTEMEDDQSGTGMEENPAVTASTEISNYIYCVFLVNYANQYGDETSYYYYVRYQDLRIDDQGSLIGDFSQAVHPEKPVIPLGEWFGDGAEVSLPGTHNLFRTVAGYETEEQLISRVIDPLRSTYTVSSLEMQ